MVFKQRVFRANEAFKCKMNDLILCHKSPMECRQYPKKSQTNRCTYRKHAGLFKYDAWKKVLYKRVKNSDGISKLTYKLSSACNFFKVILMFCVKTFNIS